MINSYITGTAAGTPFGVVASTARGTSSRLRWTWGCSSWHSGCSPTATSPIRDVLPGALLSGVVFWLLQQLSSLIISRYLHTAERAYGTFATVITILWWFYLGSIVTLAGAQLNVVLKEPFHPRGLVEGPTTTADYQAYDTYAKDTPLPTQTSESTPNSRTTRPGQRDPPINPSVARLSPGGNTSRHGHCA